MARIERIGRGEAITPQRANEIMTAIVGLSCTFTLTNGSTIVGGRWAATARVPKLTPAMRVLLPSETHAFGHVVLSLRRRPYVHRPRSLVGWLFPERN